jgi:hypothetical protein
MLVRMMVDLRGPTISLEAGDEHEFPQDEAIRLIKEGFAVPVAKPEIELAVKEPPAETREAIVPSEIVNQHRHKRRRR